MAVQTHRGSCHCGNVAFEVDLDLSAGGGKCNCSICRKTRNWSASVKPEAFRLLTDPGATTDYSRNGVVHWVFCSTCGVRPYYHGDIPEAGGAFVGVQLACLDGVDDAQLAAAPVRYANGRDNDWWHEPSAAEKAFL
ncbi:GFA family protein [Luteimonas composti]|uniref:GFA family protein n=1 Tax=Luteimonas composti TaxID=398257 RepID=A0ABT6MNS3_9GAMM|nr:GFA family protein [Luteimonas composti]MDH7452198.1 GFA family protein [Luteimonas composti]